MATIEPAAPWNDGASCRKQRTPRIGDLPRRSALDGESTTPKNTTKIVTNNSRISASKSPQQQQSSICPSTNQNVQQATNVQQQIESAAELLKQTSAVQIAPDVTKLTIADDILSPNSPDRTIAAAITRGPAVSCCSARAVSVSDPAINSRCKSSCTSNPLINKTLSLDQDGPGHFQPGNLSSSSRPIYPNVPYSPYSSPRSARRRAPLRESRRVSIEQTGSFLQLNQYKLLDSIGQGSYGLVKLAYSEEDSTHYAMKILSKRRLVRRAGLIGRGPTRGATSPLDRVYREIAVLKKLDHPNVVKLVEVLDDPLEDSLYLVFELVRNGEVLRIPTSEPLTEERARQCFRDVLLGVEYLHYQCIIHGDLKPANLLLGECGHVRVADLGVCNDISACRDDHVEAAQGTPAFRAPESLKKGTGGYSGKAADIWSLGVTLYALVFGDVPFRESSIPALYETIQTQPVCIPDTPKISDLLKDLLLSLLDKNPSTRLTMPCIKQHSWITRDGSEPLPSEEENCRLVEVTEEELQEVIKSVPKLDTLILIKTMLKKHSFQNPFLRNSVSAAGTKSPSLSQNLKSERFGKSGRSNSAPGSYFVPEKEKSSESLLPSVKEGAISETAEER